MKINLSPQAELLPVPINQNPAYYFQSGVECEDSAFPDAGKLMKYLADQGVDTRILNNIRLEFFKLDKEDKGLPIDQFSKIFKTISKLESDEAEKQIIAFLKVSTNYDV